MRAPSNALSPAELALATAIQQRDGLAGLQRWLAQRVTGKATHGGTAPPVDRPTFVSRANSTARVSMSGMASRNAQDTAQRLSATAAAVLTPGAYRTLVMLVWLALEHARLRGYSPKITHVTFGCPSEIIAFYLGIDRSTLWRHRQELERHGLLDSRAHWTGPKDKRVSDGVIWQVKLYPGRGTKAKLRYDDLKQQYRDLPADIRAGRTAWNEMQQSYPLAIDEIEAINRILPWTLQKTIQTATPLEMTVARPNYVALEAVLDVECAPTQGAERGELVNAGACAIASALGDHHSLNFYRKLLWNLLRARDHLGLYEFVALYNAVVRVRADKDEAFARNPGKLLISRLKQWDSWDEIQRCSRFGAGVTPAQA